MTDRSTVDAALSADEVVTILGIYRMLLNRLTRTLDLPYARQVGRSWVYWPEDVEALRTAIKSVESDA